MTRPPLGYEPLSECHWTRSSADAPACPPLETEIEAEFVIVGAGYTGLIAAIELAAMGRDVAVLEAFQPGWGASGRNAGHIAPMFWGAKKTPAHVIARFGEARGARMNRAIAESGRWLHDFIARHEIACDIRQGYLCLARTEKSWADHLGMFDQWRAFGGAYEAVDHGELGLHITSRRYVGGIWLPEGGSLNPLAFSRGLTEIALRMGVRIYGSSAATRAAKAPSGWRVETASGAVRCKTILICTGGYSDALFPRLRKAAYVVHCGVVATDPMPDAGASFLVGQHPIIDLDDKAVFGPAADKDGCLTVSFLVGSDRLEMADALKICRPRLEKAFPQMTVPDFQRIWAGRFTITPDGVPKILSLDDDVYAAIGCNGLGHTLGLFAARELARIAAGDPLHQACLTVQPATPVIAGPLLEWLLRNLAFPIANRML